mmetsp:Transcript_23046/g.68307  ORF Transcript_23046/g.68307 Transcript_23046/m.68307 type:complete len:217 (+) Transcript_23046:50-700(+)
MSPSLWTHVCSAGRPRRTEPSLNVSRADRPIQTVSAGRTAVMRHVEEAPLHQPLDTRLEVGQSSLPAARAHRLPQLRERDAHCARATLLARERLAPVAHGGGDKLVEAPPHSRLARRGARRRLDRSLGQPSRRALRRHRRARVSEGSVVCRLPHPLRLCPVERLAERVGLGPRAVDAQLPRLAKVRQAPVHVQACAPLWLRRPTRCTAATRSSRRS